MDILQGYVILCINEKGNMTLKFNFQWTDGLNLYYNLSKQY